MTRLTGQARRVPSGGALVHLPSDCLELCAYAATRLRALGFVHVTTSMQSEACYYAWRDLPGLFRIAAHRFGRTEQRGIARPVLSCLTFPGDYCPRSLDSVDALIAMAVGRYFMAALAPAKASDQRPSALSTDGGTGRIDA